MNILKKKNVAFNKENITIEPMKVLIKITSISVFNIILKCYIKKITLCDMSGLFLFHFLFVHLKKRRIIYHFKTLFAFPFIFCKNKCCHHGHCHSRCLYLSCQLDRLCVVRNALMSINCRHSGNHSFYSTQTLCQLITHTHKKIV